MPEEPQEQTLGPVSYLVVEFPGNQTTGEGFVALLDLVDRGLIRILDLKFVSKASDGSVRAVELGDLDHDDTFDPALLEGASSGMIDASDVADVGEVLEAGSAAGILIFENHWALPFVRALRRRGAELVAAGYIPQDALVASLDAAETAAS